VIAGGGALPEEVAKRTLELAGGKAAKVLTVPLASELPDAAEKAVEFWRKHGAESVTALDVSDPKAAVAAVRAADLIWFGGGDQNRLMARLKGTGVPEAVRERYAAGAVVGGTSAGAAAMSRRMITGDADNERVAAGDTKTAEGLALWPEAIVDQHFLRRGRFNRLLSAVLDAPDLVGVGIDESTAAVVTDGGRTVQAVGKGGVLIIDARKTRPPDSKAGEPSSTGAGAGASLHLLRPGQRFDLSRGVAGE
jgi:cyanophycinase